MFVAARRHYRIDQHSRIQFNLMYSRVNYQWHANANDVTVKTLIYAAARPTIAIDFGMESQRNGWKVYDVLVDGTSVTTRFREALAEGVRRSGICAQTKDRNASRFAITRDSHRRAFA